jgi:Tol biopolymer transport system component
MPLGAGSRVGGYDIVALIGVGGMGEVYRARDGRLGRDVALKVLSPRIAADANSLTRFEREARALAALNHPNIASIYGIEDGAGQPALILELVDGQTLADRLASGPLSVNEALEYARQIADALDAAHEAGIVHRDLKPGNVKITGDGRVKVLDFGLAKAAAAAAGLEPNSDPAHSPTITVHGTAQGVILGTAAYMSPEQARGKAIDKRTDIWAFGCVLVEMLSGRRPFTGETTSDIIAAIIERAPDLSALPASTPPHVRRVIERCLEKDAKRRARDIGDVRAELDRPAAPEHPPTRSAWAGALAAIAAVAALAILGFTAWRWSSSPPVSPPEPIEFAFGAPPNHTLEAVPATISPDGRRIAFLARDEQQVSSVWIRSIDASAARRLAGTERATGPTVWSPDGRELAFFAGDAWKRINAEGGPAITIVSGLVGNLGASWGPDDRLLIGPANRTSLSRVGASGGPLEPVTTLDTERENSHRWPQLLPDGRHFLFTVRSDQPDNLGVKIGEFGSPSTRFLVNAASPGRYVAPGWLLFMTPDEALMAQRLDPRTWTVSGTPQAVAAPVRYNGPSFSGVFAVSADGRVLTYVAGTRSGSRLVWFDSTGRSLGTLGSEMRYRGLALAPGERMAAVELADDRYGTRDIWLIDQGTQAATRLTSHPATDWQPVFSPDGSRIAFASDRAGASTVFVMATSGSGGEAVIYRNPKGSAFPTDWSRDGKQILVEANTPERAYGLVAIAADSGTPTVVLEDEATPVSFSSYSPEGDRVAFVSSVTGTREVYVMSLADHRRIRVSTDGGVDAKWGRDGGELFFRTLQGEIIRARLERTTLALAGSPQRLFRPCVSVDLVFLDDVGDAVYDVTADGSRFIATCGRPEAVPSAVTVVLNWQSRLRD